MVATDGAYEAVCEAWWREVQQDAQAEGNAGAERIVEYSFLFEDRLATSVLKGTGELLGSTTVSTTPARVSKAKSNDRMFGCCRMFQCPRKFNQKPKYISPGPKFGAGSECETAPREVSVRTVGETITAALKTMGVRGRDAMVRQAKRQSAEDAVQEDASLRQGTEVEADTAQGRLDAIKCDQEVLGAFYQHLLAPVEAHLEGATEVLIILQGAV